MAQPESHIEIDAQPARRLVKRIMRDAEQANRELARLEDRCADLERRLAAEYGISIQEDA